MMRRRSSGYRFAGDRGRLSKGQARMVKTLETRGLKAFRILRSAEVPRFTRGNDR